MVVIDRVLKSGKRFMVSVEDGRATATCDGEVVGRGAGEVGWLLPKVGRVAGKVGGTLVAMSDAEHAALGKALYAREMAEAARARSHNRLYNEGADGYAP